MIKIIKKGKAIQKTVTWYKVKCSKCGCEYYVTEDEFIEKTDPNWTPILGTIYCPNEDCPMHKKTATYTFTSRDILELPEGEEPEGGKDE